MKSDIEQKDEMPVVLAEVAAMKEPSISERETYRKLAERKDLVDLFILTILIILCAMFGLAIWVSVVDQQYSLSAIIIIPPIVLVVFAYLGISIDRIVLGAITVAAIYLLIPITFLNSLVAILGLGLVIRVITLKQALIDRATILALILVIFILGMPLVLLFLQYQFSILTGLSAFALLLAIIFFLIDRDVFLLIALIALTILFIYIIYIIMTPWAESF